MRPFRIWFITGVLVLLPLVATITALTTLLGWVDGILQPLTIQFLGRWIPGAGTLLLFLLVLGAGLATSHVLSRKILRFGNQILTRFPLTGSIYTTAQRMVTALMAPGTQLGRVALVQYPRRGLYALGFVTSSLSFRETEYLSIFVPSTPLPLFGWTILAPAEEVLYLPYSAENALTYIISLGLVSLKATEPSAASRPS